MKPLAEKIFGKLPASQPNLRQEANLRRPINQADARPRVALKTFFPWALLALTIGVLLFQARLPQWRDHLQIDVRIYLLRCWSFVTDGNWRHLDFSEYPPATLWLFALVSWFTVDPNQYDVSFNAFLSAIIILNVLLIAAHFLFFQRYGSRHAPLIFLALVLAMGPILLFRFELLTTILLLLAGQLFGRQHFRGSAALLGFVTCLKLYGAILFPLLVLDLFRRKLTARIFQVILFFLAGLLLPTLAFFLCGGSWRSIAAGVRMQQQRTIALEGFWGTLVTLVQAAAGIPRRVIDLNHERGLMSDVSFLSNNIVGILGILLTLLVLLWILRSSRTHRLCDPAWAFLLLFTFAFFAKHENPQYQWWFASFLPFLPMSIHPRMRWTTTALLFLSLALAQIVYPLHYSEFLDWFYGQETSSRYFVVSAVRNGLLLAALAGAFTEQFFTSRSLRLGDADKSEAAF